MTETSRSSDGLREVPQTNNPFMPCSLSIAAPYVRLESCTYNSIELNRSSNVEILEGDILRIIDIIRNTKARKTYLRGWIFRRTREMNGVLDRKLNEVCWILHVDENDSRDASVQGIETVPISEVVKKRRLRMTNLPFPELSWRTNPKVSRDVESDGVLICRFKYVCSYADSKARAQNRWCEKALYRLRENESDSMCGKSDKELRYFWRGETLEGGGCKNFLKGEAEYLDEERRCPNMELTEHRNSRSSSRSRSQSTQCDSFISLMEEPETIQLRNNGINNEPKDFYVQRSNNLQPGGCRRPHGFSTSFIREDPNISEKETYSAEKSIILEYLNLHADTKLIDLTMDEQNHGIASAIKNNAHYTIRESSNHSSRLGCSARQRCHKRPSDDITGVVYCKKKRVNTDDRSQVLESMETVAKLNFTNAELRRKSPSYFVTVHKQPENHMDERRLESTFKSMSTTERWNSNATVDGRPEPSASQHATALTSTRYGQRYTFGDCFCGAGGTSRGAIGAGLRVEWGFDFDLGACESYKLNFYRAQVYNLWAHQFSNLADQDHKVDICHLSPPCQFFSDAHTVYGKDDDMNVASLFAISELLQKAKPRVVTLEQTSGLAKRHVLFFNSVILMFTAQGFSVRWRILNFADFGLPQNRVRVFIIASCPGEALPPFPQPTHTSSPLLHRDRKPWTTINDAINHIPPGWLNHNVASMRNRNRAPQDGNTLARCMTTSGADMVHPSGRRSMTYREFACLQGFPLEHKFGSRGVKKQIGNAVPPVVAKVVLEEIKRALMKADGLLPE